MNRMKLTLMAREMYKKLLERYYYSLKNNFKDKNGSICVIFPHEELMTILEISKPTAIKYLRELEDKNYIVKRRLGRGKPNLIYFPYKQNINTLSFNKNISKKVDYHINKNGNEQIKKEAFYYEEYKNEIQAKKEAIKSNRTENTNNMIDNKVINKEIKSDMKQNVKPNKKIKKIKATNTKYKEKFINIQIEKLKKNINYDELKNMDKFKDNNILESYIDIIKDNLYKNSVRVNKCFINIDTFIDRILKLNKEHILYVYECILNVKTQIKNVPSYLLTSIFNAVNTFQTYINNKNSCNKSITNEHNNKSYIKKLTYVTMPTYTGQELEDVILSNNDLDMF